MSAKEILIVEDEHPIREMLALGLIRAGFRTREAADGSSALSQLAERQPHLMLIDWMLPDESGLEITRRLKSKRSTREMAIIILTARADEHDKVAGFESGADDYVTKPFSPRELIARINAVLRRGESIRKDESFRIDGLTLDPINRTVVSADRRLQIPPAEYRLLEFFMSHPERVYTRAQLLDDVWGANGLRDERTIDVHILRLRKVLEEGRCAHLLQTVRGVGYRGSDRTGRWVWVLPPCSSIDIMD